MGHDEGPVGKINVDELHIIDNIHVEAGTIQNNGTNAVTITAVAPAAVTTATISNWLKIEVAGNGYYYIPLWT